MRAALGVVLLFAAATAVDCSYLRIEIGLGPGSASKPLFSDAELAGSYYRGDGLGMNEGLRLTVKHAFTEGNRTDTGASWGDAGKWQLERDVVVLKPNRAGADDFALRLVPVRMNHKLFLIDENHAPGVLSFSRRKGLGGLASRSDLHGMEFVKVAPKDFGLLRVEGSDAIPKQFVDFYKHGPIDAKVSSLLKDGHVIVSSGQLRRMRAGVLMTRTHWADVDVRILKVEKRYALGEVIYYEGSDSAIKAGDVLTTGRQYTMPSESDMPRRKSPPTRQR